MVKTARRIDQDTFDVVITDLVMNDMDGMVVVAMPGIGAGEQSRPDLRLPLSECVDHTQSGQSIFFMANGHIV